MRFVEREDIRIGDQAIKPVGNVDDDFVLGGVGKVVRPVGNLVDQRADHDAEAANHKRDGIQDPNHLEAEERRRQEGDKHHVFPALARLVLVLVYQNLLLVSLQPADEVVNRAHRAKPTAEHPAEHESNQHGGDAQRHRDRQALIQPERKHRPNQQGNQNGERQIATGQQPDSLVGSCALERSLYETASHDSNRQRNPEAYAEQEKSLC